MLIQIMEYRQVEFVYWICYMIIRKEMGQQGVRRRTNRTRQVLPWGAAAGAV